MHRLSGDESRLDPGPRCTKGGRIVAERIGVPALGQHAGLDRVAREQRDGRADGSDPRGQRLRVPRRGRRIDRGQRLDVERGGGLSKLRDLRDEFVALRPRAREAARGDAGVLELDLAQEQVVSRRIVEPARGDLAEQRARALKILKHPKILKPPKIPNTPRSTEREIDAFKPPSERRGIVVEPIDRERKRVIERGGVATRSADVERDRHRVARGRQAIEAANGRDDGVGGRLGVPPRGKPLGHPQRDRRSDERIARRAHGGLGRIIDESSARGRERGDGEERRGGVARCAKRAQIGRKPLCKPFGGRAAATHRGRWIARLGACALQAPFDGGCERLRAAAGPHVRAELGCVANPREGIERRGLVADRWERTATARVFPARHARDERRRRIAAVRCARKQAIAERRIALDASAREREDVAKRLWNGQLARRGPREEPLRVGARRDGTVAGGRACGVRGDLRAEAIGLAARKVGGERRGESLERMGAEDGGVGRDRCVRREARRDEGRREPRLDRGEERPRVAEFGGACQTDGDRGISVRDRVHAKKKILGRFKRELAGGERRVEREPLEKRRAQPLDFPLGRDRVGDRARGGTEANRLGRKRRARPHARRRLLARPRAEPR